MISQEITGDGIIVGGRFTQHEIFVEIFVHGVPKYSRLIRLHKLSTIIKVHTIFFIREIVYKG